jgi:hypothetical protein
MAKFEQELREAHKKMEESNQAPTNAKDLEKPKIQEKEPKKPEDLGKSSRFFLDF